MFYIGRELNTLRLHRVKRGFAFREDEFESEP